MRVAHLFCATIVALSGCSADESLGLPFECVATPLSPPASGGTYAARLLDLFKQADTIVVVVIRVAQAAYFEAVPVESASVQFVPRTPQTFVSADSARTDTVGRAQTTMSFAGESAIVDVTALVSGTPVNRSPIGVCVRRGI